MKSHAPVVTPYLSPSSLTSLPQYVKMPGRRNHVLMARPTEFSLSGEINAWMHLVNQPDPERALAQWTGLRDTLVKAGFTIDEETAPKEWPDFVFTANAGLAAGVNGVPTFIPSRFVHPERQGEEPLYRAAFAARGFRIVSLFDEGETWEGEGDMLEHEGVLFGGYGQRSRVSAHQKVANYLGMPLVTLHLSKAHFYHLDTALAFLDEKTILYYPAAFEAQSRMVLQRYADTIPGARLIAVSAEDAGRFACNSIVLDRRIVMNQVSDALVAELTAAGFTVVQTPLSEFLKSGGAAKCLVQFAPAFSLRSRVPLEIH